MLDVNAYNGFKMITLSLEAEEHVIKKQA